MRQATLKKVEDRTVVEEGDYALASVEAFEDGKPMSPNKPEDRLVEVSERALAHGVHEALIGAEIGKEMKASKTYAADYTQKELAGKTVEWRATPKEIYRRELPTVDDDFAKDLGDENLEAFRTRVRAELLAHAKQEADARVRQGLLDLVIERNPVELPESLVAREVAAMEAELHQTLEAGGLSHEDATARVKQNADDLKSRAEKRARTALIVDALADQEKIEINAEELGDRVAQIVTQSGRNRDRAAEFYRKEENREGLRQSMRREKALDFILSRAQREDAPSAPPEERTIRAKVAASPHSDFLCHSERSEESRIFSSALHRHARAERTRRAEHARASRRSRRYPCAREARNPRRVPLKSITTSRPSRTARAVKRVHLSRSSIIATLFGANHGLLPHFRVVTI